MPGVVCGSMVSAVRSLAWGLMCTRALSLACCSSSWYWKRFRVSSALLILSFFMLMTCYSSQTPRRSVSSSSRRERLAWKIKGPHVNMKMIEFLVPGAGLDLLKKSGKCPCAFCCCGVNSNSIECRNASCGSTRGVVVSLSNWWPTQTVFAPGVMARLSPLMAELWLKLTAPCCADHILPPDLLCSGCVCVLCVLCVVCCVRACVRSCVRVWVSVPLLASRCCVARGMFQKQLSVLTTRHLSFKICSRVYEACDHSVTLFVSKTCDQTTLNASGSFTMTAHHDLLDL